MEGKVKGRREKEEKGKGGIEREKEIKDEEERREIKYFKTKQSFELSFGEICYLRKKPSLKKTVGTDLLDHSKDMLEYDSRGKSHNPWNMRCL